MYATVIIDDPLLRENYGFLNYKRLLDLMDKHNFHTTIAFIPWNYNRSHRKIVDLFKKRPDRFSLCVHGCDHTGGEFGSKDINYLDKKIKIATFRMIEHEKRTGIPFDKIMVFPQGVFSNEALEILKANGYLAAVNTELPINGKINSDFPFFQRYKPENITNQDPAFIVLHHEYFKNNGYETLSSFVDGLNIRGAQWDSLGNVISHFVKSKEASCVYLDELKSGGIKQRAKIAMRRYASEFRDNYLCKSDILLNYAKQVKKVISK